MKTWLVKDARAHLGDVIDGALAGTPQRIARRGREAVVLVSEHTWEGRSEKRPRKMPSKLLAECPLTTEEWQELLPERRPYRPSTTFDE